MVFNIGNSRSGTLVATGGKHLELRWEVEEFMVGFQVGRRIDRRNEPAKVLVFARTCRYMD